MKKQDILNLINAKKTIQKYKKILSIIREQNYNYYIDEKLWFPNIHELDCEFNILKKEILEAKKETEKAEAIIKNTPCDHAVRIKFFSVFWNNNHCVLCNHIATSDNCSCFEEMTNRNKHTVTFKSKLQSNEDGYYEIEKGKTENEIIEIILSILNNFNDEDDIDLVKEFSKLNIEDIEINSEIRKEDTYILIIGGTNIKYIDKDTYITKKNNLNSKLFFNYFKSFINTKIAVIDRNLNLDEDIDYSKIKILNYHTLDEFKNLLGSIKKYPFKLIIDLSSFYEYNISNKTINNERINFDLNSFFPNATIVKITELTNIKDLEMIKQYLNSLKKNDEIEIITDNIKYYYLNNGNLKNDEFEQTCNFIKKLVKR